MSTLSQLVLETAALLGDSGGNRWKTAIANPPVLGVNDVQYMLNLAALEFNLQAGVYRVAIPVTATARNSKISLLDQSGQPPFGALLRLEDGDGKALFQTSADALNTTVGLDWMNAAPGRSKQYIRGLDGFGTVRLFPAPAKSATFTAYCVAEPVPMLTAADLPWIGGGSNKQDSPAQYHGALPFYAAWYGFLFNNTSQDLAAAEALRKEFDLRVARAAAEVRAALSPQSL